MVETLPPNLVSEIIRPLQMGLKIIRFFKLQPLLFVIEHEGYSLKLPVHHATTDLYNLSGSCKGGR